MNEVENSVLEAAAACANIKDGITPAQIALIMTRLREGVGDRHFDAAFWVARGLEAKEDRPKAVESVQFIVEQGEAPPMFIEKLVPEKSIVLLTAKPKMGKSYLALDIADSVARGGLVCGSFGVSRPGPVLYINMENGPIEHNNRLRKRGLKTIDPPGRLYHINARMVLSSPEGIALLNQIIEEDLPEPPVFCVIDTAAEGLDIKDWNGNQAEVRDKLRPLVGWARNHCSTLLVAHNKKSPGLDDGDEIAGSVAFSGGVDGWVSVQRAEKQNNGNRRMWLSIVGRGDMEGSVVVEMDTENLHFRTIDDRELEQGYQEEKQTEKARKFDPVLGFVRGRINGRATVAEIAGATGEAIHTARRTVAEMVKSGLLVDSGEKQKSTPGQGTPAPLYTLPDLLLTTPSYPKENAPFVNNPPDLVLVGAVLEPRETGPVGPPAIDADVSDLSDPFGGEGIDFAPVYENVEPVEGGPRSDQPDYIPAPFVAGEPSGVVWHFAPRSYDPKKGTWTASAGGFHGASGKSQREALDVLREEAAGGVKTYFPFGEEEGVTLDVAAALTACALELGRLDVEGEPVDAPAWLAERGA